MKLLIKFFILFKGKYSDILNRIIFKKNNVNIKSSFKVRGRIFVNNYGSILIGKDFKANSSKNYNPIGGDTILRLVVMNGGQLLIRNNVGISNSTIVCSKKIEIGNHVLIGGGCKIWDTDFHSLDPKERAFNGDKDVKNAPIHIEDHVFIGAGSIILKGVSVGENSIIGAGSLVSKSIPKNQIWGGNPAKFIRNLDINTNNILSE